MTDEEYRVARAAVTVQRPATIAPPAGTKLATEMTDAEYRAASARIGYHRYAPMRLG